MRRHESLIRLLTAHLPAVLARVACGYEAWNTVAECEQVAKRTQALRDEEARLWKCHYAGLRAHIVDAQLAQLSDVSKWLGSHVNGVRGVLIMEHEAGINKDHNDCDVCHTQTDHYRICMPFIHIHIPTPRRGTRWFVVHCDEEQKRSSVVVKMESLLSDAFSDATSVECVHLPYITKLFIVNVNEEGALNLNLNDQ
jgi:hypothetical protein